MRLARMHANPRIMATIPRRLGRPLNGSLLIHGGNPPGRAHFEPKRRAADPDRELLTAEPLKFANAALGHQHHLALLTWACGTLDDQRVTPVR
jgi:hypothetical protein